MSVLAVMGCGGASVRNDSVRARMPDVPPPTVVRMELPGWVSAKVCVVGSESEAISTVRNRALTLARREAIQFISGVAVTSGFMSFQGMAGTDSVDVVRSLDFSRCSALIVDERRGAEEIRNFAGGFSMTLTLHARVLDLREKSDPGFVVEADLGDRRFIDGENLEMAFRTTADARIIAINITDDGAIVLLPNQFMTETLVNSGQWLRFPGTELLRRGVVLKAQVPKGATQSVESLVVVAVKADSPMPAWATMAPSEGVFRAEEGVRAFGMLGEVLAPLTDIPPESWTMLQIPYEVVAQ